MSAEQWTSLIVGDSAPMRELRALIARLGPTDLSVLIEGPSGAGKELAALALHHASGRSGAFVPVNVCAVPETMFEDAFFGHVRGAFTGATCDTPGFMGEADGGTLFLDEIGDLTAGGQPKLLRAVETGQYRPIGAKADRRSGFRLVCATNDRLEELVTVGRFRHDLYRRIDAVRIRVPPLVEHRDDLPQLVVHFTALAVARGLPARQFGTRCLEVLHAHSWPGSVRELKQVVDRALVLGEGSDVSELLLGCLIQGGGRSGELESVNLGRRRLVEILDNNAWDTAHVARLLGVHRSTLYRRMRRLQIDCHSRPVFADPKMVDSATCVVPDAAIRG